MLETIREYGLERAEEAGELAAIREAHARHYLALAVARRIRTYAAPTRSPGCHGCDAEHDNLLAALRHLGESGDTRAACAMVVALLWFWLLSGSSRDEVLAWVEFARGLPGEADPLDRVMIEAVHALANVMPGQPGEGDPFATLHDGARADRGRGPRPPSAAGGGAADAGHRGRSRADARAAGALGGPPRSRGSRATAPFVRVQITENEGDIEGLRAALDESVAAFGEVGDRWGLATTLAELAGLRVLEGDLDGAESALEQTRSLMAELGARNDGAMMGLRLADVRARRGDHEGARAMLAAELDARERFAEENAMLRIVAGRCSRCAPATPPGRGSWPTRRCDELAPTRGRRPEQGHVRAVVLSGAALLELLSRGEREAAAVRC